MKKKSIILTFVLCFILILTSCVKDTDDSTGGQDGIHDYIIGETSNYIVKDGATSYKIVKSENAGYVINMAVNELQHFFKEATGIELEVIDDKNISYSEDVKYLSIGDNKLLKDANIAIDKNLLGNDGLRIVTKGNSVFLFGGGDYGSLYSVYEFLHQTFSFEAYYKDCYTLDSNVREIKLMDYNITDVPDIAKRASNYSFIDGNLAYINRLRLRTSQDYIISVGHIWHNSFHYLDPDAYQEDHPNFYSLDGKQLCYTARGNSNEYTLMVDLVAQTIIEKRKEYPDYNVITMTVQDNTSSCSCSFCAKMKSDYGSEAAAVVVFLNNVNKKIQAWFDTPEGKKYDRNFDILFFAYHKYEDAPARLNKDTNQYEPVNGLRCDDNVCVLYAPINANYSRSLYDVSNASTYNNSKAWNAVSKKVYLWLYSTNFRYYLIPYNSFPGIQGTYKACNEVNAEFLIDQAQTTQRGSATGWCILKAYLNAKLAWNSSLDYQQLVDNFFNAMYGNAAPFMREYFERYKALCAYNEEFKRFGGDVYFNALSRDFWPKQELLVWEKCIDKALESIEYLKGKDINQYNSYYDHIIAERISIYYLLVELHSTSVLPQKVMDMKLQVKEDVRRLGITHLSEGSVIENLFASWDIEEV